MPVFANVDKDWKAKGQHNDTFAQEGRLFCATDAQLWPCDRSERGSQLAAEKAAAEKATAPPETGKP